MRVKIGPHRRWVGPYQIADVLQYVGVSEDRCFAIGSWLNDTTPLGKICNWIYSKLKRKVYIKIDNYDAWNADRTLAMVILPLLRKLQEQKHGSPHVDDSDVPEHLQTSAAKELTEEERNSGHTDELWHDRWEWVLNEMIWAFEQWQPECDWEAQYHQGVIDFNWVKIDKQFENPLTGKIESLYQMERTEKDTSSFDSIGYQKHMDRITNGFSLFGKYYTGLWS